MSFNFQNLANTKPAATTSYLKPYQIHDNVVIKSTEVKEGTSSNGNAWKSLNITFGNDEGIFTHSIFYFDEKDSTNWERGTKAMQNGGYRKTPSKAEELQNTLAAIGFAYFPEDFKKLQGIAGKIQTTDQLMDYFKKFVDKNLEKNPTSIKLVGRESNNKVYAAFPKFTGIAEAKDSKQAADNGVNVGDWYTWTVTPFGSNLTFNNYEMGKANEYNNATPTPMKDNNETSEEIDFDSLL